MMKNTFLAATVVLALVSCAKKLTIQDVPQSVQTEFIDRYEEVSNLRWVMKKDMYRACFDLNEKKMEVDFDASGKVIEVRSK
jgi:hypothetical protein